MNVDDTLVNADWTKQTCDYPLDVMGLCADRPVVRAELTAASVPYDGGGGMVALYPGEPGRIARPGGQEASDLHCTLLFFPDGVPAGTYGVVEAVASAYGPLEGNLTGVARFQAGEDGVPVIALPSVVGLNELRTVLADECSGYSDRYGFIPHITLGYERDASAVGDPDEVVGLPVVFDAISVVDGGRRVDFPLLGESDTL